MNNIVYIYDKNSGEYLRTEKLQSDPKNEGQFFPKMYSTNIKPPDVNQNQVACFINSSWVIKPDFRGQIYYDKTTRQSVIINFIGDIPDNLVFNLPEIEPTKEELVIKNINEEYNKFYPELKAFFKPACDAVIEYLNNNEPENALRVIQNYPLPQGYTFDDGEGSTKTLEDYRRDLMNLIIGG